MTAHRGALSTAAAIAWATAGLVAAALVAGVGAPGALAAPTCTTPDSAGEPPCNPYLPDSPWGASHRNAYAQASSPYPGIAAGAKVSAHHVYLPGIPIQLQFTSKYRDGGRAVWGSLVDAFDRRAVFKLDQRSGRLIDLYIPAEREANPPKTEAGGVTGAYSILDRDGRFIVPRQRTIDVFADSRKGDRSSPIRLVKRFAPPARAFCGASDKFVGATMTYDGMIAFATERGVVGVVPRLPSRMTARNVRTVSLDPAHCRGARAEIVSNSIAADEDGGIYVVTSRLMHRVSWNAERKTLRPAWQGRYVTKGATSAVRLGPGSGSTPTVMGTGRQRDRFVAITDGAKLMNMVLMWRGAIPKGWKPIAPGKDRRIACEVPVRFGDPHATSSLSEQSLAVRGYAAINVNNRIPDESPFAGASGVLLNALAALEGGNPANAPHGMERIDWDPRTRTCHRVWANRDISVPNGIPTMSAASGLVYGIRQEQGRWGVAGLDFRTGRVRLDAPAPDGTCTPQALAGLPDAAKAALSATIARLPQSCGDSFYAATEVGPDRTIWTGTFLGVTVYRQTG
jgi:hypothetical protein